VVQRSRGVSSESQYDRDLIAADVCVFRMTLVAAIMRNLSAHSSLADIVSISHLVPDPRQKLDLHPPSFAVTAGCHCHAYHVQDQETREPRSITRFSQVRNASYAM
jgi:hypothetical protein